MVGHVIIETTNGLFGYGRNIYSQLGLDRDVSIHVLTKIPFDEEIISIHYGTNSTIFCTTTGLFGCGYNSNGQIPIPNGVVEEITKIPLDGKIILCSSGSNFIVIYTTDGLFACGYGTKGGKLGQGAYNASSTFNKVPDFNHEVLSISCGRNHVVVDTNQGLFGCGSDEYGQLGMGDTEYIEMFTKIGLSDVISVDCADDHTFVNTASGLFASGRNLNYQLGLEGEHIRKFTKIDLPTGIISVHTSDCHTILLSREKKMFISGSSRYEKFVEVNFEHDIIQIYNSCYYAFVHATDGLYIFSTSKPDSYKKVDFDHTTIKIKTKRFANTKSARTTLG